MRENGGNQRFESRPDFEALRSTTMRGLFSRPPAAAISSDCSRPKIIRPDGEVFPTGGNALLLGGAEVRYDLTGSFQLAAFLDVGNVYPEVRDLSIPDLRKSVGLGVRYLTPIGPIRLDYGHKIQRLPGETPGRFHLTIGYAF